MGKLLTHAAKAFDSSWPSVPFFTGFVPARSACLGRCAGCFRNWTKRRESIPQAEQYSGGPPLTFRDFSPKSAISAGGIGGAKGARVNFLSQTKSGRVLLHALCLLRCPRHAAWHWRGMLREFGRRNIQAPAVNNLNPIAGNGIHNAVPRAFILNAN